MEGARRPPGLVGLAEPDDSAEDRVPPRLVGLAEPDDEDSVEVSAEVEVVEASPGGDLTRHADPDAVVDALAASYGIPRATLERFEYYHTGHKLFALQKAEGAQVSDLPKLDLYRVGLYVARIEGSLPHGLRLTIDGAQLWGRECAWWVELDDASFLAWMRGDEPPLPTQPGKVKLPPAPIPWFVVKHRGLPVGCSKRAKERLMNFVPKERRTPPA